MNRKPNGDKYNIYRDGLKIYTTIDSRMQTFAETATKTHMRNLQAEFFVQNTPIRNPTTPFLDHTSFYANALNASCSNLAKNSHLQVQDPKKVL